MPVTYCGQLRTVVLLGPPLGTAAATPAGWRGFSFLTAAPGLQGARAFS
jgi:hypothetical protein